MQDKDNSKYKVLEERTNLFLDLGRIIQKEDNDLNFKTNGTSILESEFEAYQWLQKKGLITVANPIPFEGINENEITADITLTEKGKSTYRATEETYREHLERLSSTFSGD